MTETEKIIGEFQKQLDKFKKGDGFLEPLATIITTHLYVEYYINYIIKNQFKLQKKILEDHRNYSFAIKLDFIYEKGFIPKWLYDNIKKLNNIRNGYSHNLEYDVLNADLSFNIPNDHGKIDHKDLKKEYDMLEKDSAKRNVILIFQIPSLTLMFLVHLIERNKY